MAIRIITAPTVEPIDITAVAGQCRTGDLSSEADTVNGYIVAIRQKCANDLRRTLITTTYDLVLDAFPSPSNRNPFAALEIPLPPLQSVVSIKCMSTDLVLTTLDPTMYVVDTDSTPGRVMPAYGKAWPATLDYPGSVRVQFTSGYGDTADDVPQCIKNWMLLNVANLFENRESESVSDSRMSQIDLSTMADSLLDPERWEVRV